MGVAQCPYVTGSDGSAYYISAVPAWGCGAQDRRYVEIVLYRTGAFYAVKTLQGELLVQTAVLFVEGVAELLKYDYRVGKMRGCCPLATTSENILSTLVMLKFPQSISEREHQLLRRRNGCT